MQRTGGSADPATVNEVLRDELDGKQGQKQGQES
jgi:Asp-tRNA(Asn)/Glu-tRNA(Gln) amidotransferase B subunit